MLEVLRSELADGVLVLSLARPHRHNAFDDELYEQLDRATADAVATPDVRCIVIRGDGPSFSSGRDTTMLGRHEARDRLRLSAGAQTLNRRIAATDVPVLAALHGHVLGKGLEIALACDLRVVARGAQLGFPEIGFGLITDNGGAAQVTVTAGPSRAKYLLMTGESIDADLALAWGLVDLVVERDELDDRVLALARRIAGHAPSAVAMAKSTVNGYVSDVIRQGMRSEMLGNLALFAERPPQSGDQA